MKSIRQGLLVAAAGFAVAGIGLVGCGSTPTEQKVEKEVQATPAPKQAGDLASEGHQAFLNAPNLTEAQKIKLSEVMKTTYAEAIKIKEEIGKSKLVLFKTITSPDYKQKEVDVIKKKITKLDQKRLEIMFKSLDDVQKIIGRNPETAEYLQRIMKEHMHSGEYEM